MLSRGSDHRIRFRRRRQPRGLRVVALLSSLTLAAVCWPAASAQADAFIDNGTIQLGVHDFGDLNVPGGTPSSGGVTTVGLRYIPNNAEATAPGCLCEGWGAADATSGVTGSANEDFGGATPNLSLVSFTSNASSAVSVVDILDASSNPVLRVTQDYHPSAATPNLYEVTVTIQNVSSSPVDARYRRVMDWDMVRSSFDEFVTIQGGTSTALLFDSDDGFADADELRTGRGRSTTPVRPAPGQTPSITERCSISGLAPSTPVIPTSFRIYYGAAGDESSALAALGAVGAEVFSFGQPSTPDGPTLGLRTRSSSPSRGWAGPRLWEGTLRLLGRPQQQAVPAEKKRLCGGKQPTIIGTGQPETLTGTAGRDVIVGLGGNDVLNGLSGNDFLCGGRGKDNLRGGAGGDTLIGGAGPDTLDGGASIDRLFGGTPKAPPDKAIDTCKGGADTKRNCELVG